MVLHYPTVSAKFLIVLKKINEVLSKGQRSQPEGAPWTKGLRKKSEKRMMTTVI